jgi:E3 ubiquitin-protein ligase MARCH6
MRLVTDPVVDSLAYVATHFLLPPWINAFKRVVITIGEAATRLAEMLLGKNAVDQVSVYSNKLVCLFPALQIRC